MLIIFSREHLERLTNYYVKNSSRNYNDHEIDYYRNIKSQVVYACDAENYIYATNKDITIFKDNPLWKTCRINTTSAFPDATKVRLYKSSISVW